MLSAHTHLEFGSSTLRSTVFLERRMRVHMVQRDRLLFDTAYAAPAQRASSNVHLFAQLTGTFEPAGASPVPGPCAFVLAETEFDRIVPGALTFRSFGARCTIIEARIPAADLRRPIGLAHGQVPLADSVWDAYHAMQRNPSEAAVHHLILTLGETGVLSRDLTASVVAEEPERFQRVWAVLRPLYENLATSASLKQISILAGLSLRQSGRDLTDLTRTFGLFGLGFRDVMRVLRLRAAVLLLSAPDATPSEVARTVGYGSLDAMGRAFRDEHLPAPSIIQAAVRFRD
ncbi:MAG TPA: helix-turn-helix domain-containing protein [Kofleriaceae bacterium]|nr:helix-turn-helix domain-containing protein [Kofleriaceae bacterium]